MMSKSVTPLAAVVVCMFATSLGLADAPKGPLAWRAVGNVNIQEDYAAVGYLDGWLILIKGDGQDTYRVVHAETGEELASGRLGHTATGCASVTAGNTYLVIGGRDGETWSARVNAVQVLAQPDGAAAARVEAWPDLPEALAWPSAATAGGRLFVVGRSQAAGGEHVLYTRPTDSVAGAWDRGADLPPGLGRTGALVAQASGERECLYLVTENRGVGNCRLHEFDPVKRRWRERSALPEPMTAEQVTPMGAHHILIAGSLNDTRVSYIYHTIMDRWAPIDSAQLRATVRVVRPSREPLLLCQHEAGGSGLYRIEGAQPRPRFFWLDYTALGAYLLLLVAVGVYFTRGERTTDDFFLAGRRIPWWAAALSLMATQVSSIGFIAVPAKTFATDWVYFIGVLSWFVVVPIVTRVYIPFFRRLNVTSAYEYLEARFNVSVRLFAAVVFSLLQIGRMAVVLYLPALVLSVVTGIPIYGCVLIMGVLATAYTTAGGMEAVIWTDVLQALLLLGGAILCVIVAIAKTDGGVGEVVATAFADDKLRLVGTSWDITTGAVWVILIGSVFSRFASVSADQSVIQRYLTTTDEKQAARALWGDVAVSIPWAFIVFMMGTALYVFYKAHPGQVTPGLGADAMVPLFVSQQLPMGVSGLIIAAIFAAAMSSLDSSIHSVATVMMTDMYQRFRPSSSERLRLNLARTLTVLLGAFGTGMALFMASTFVVSVWDVFLEIMGLLAGVLAGLFLLGLFTVRANSGGALIGALLGALALYWVKQHTDIHFFLYSVIGIGVCFFGGYALSVLLPGVPKVHRLTIFTQHREESPVAGTEPVVSVSAGPDEEESL